MIKVEQSQYTNLRLMLKGIKTTPTFALAIVDGFIEGDVLTDSVYRDSYLIGTKRGIYFVCGQPNQPFIDQFQTYYNMKLAERFTIFTANTEWEYIIAGIITDRSKVMKRKMFTLNNRKFLCASPVDDTSFNRFEIKPINKATMMQSSIFDQQYYVRHWGNVEAFLKNGFGFCAVNEDGEIVSECTSIYRNKSKAEIDIYTNEKVRGRGLALKLAESFIHQCLERNLMPSWDCAISNQSSLHVAKLLKFDRGESYTLFHK